MPNKNRKHRNNRKHATRELPDFVRAVGNGCHWNTYEPFHNKSGPTCVINPYGDNNKAGQDGQACMMKVRNEPSVTYVGKYSGQGSICKSPWYSV